MAGLTQQVGLRLSTDASAAFVQIDVCLFVGYPGLPTRSLCESEDLPAGAVTWRIAIALSGRPN